MSHDPPLIWLVRGVADNGLGHWPSDHERITWDVAAYTTREAAELHCGSLNQRLKYLRRWKLKRRRHEQSMIREGLDRECFIPAPPGWVTYEIACVPPPRPPRSVPGTRLM